ncbi:2Fe-2S iron-sulfur cluster binding domain-containing protein [bacterium]|nr:2Fe-2S iron-sulfur cluster binding domain-containing protein [bacterium]
MEGEMGKMMSAMMEGGLSPQPVFPSLMNLAELSPEQRTQVEEIVRGRMGEGIAGLSRGLERFSASVSSGDPLSLREATEEMRAGIRRFESSAAAYQALSVRASPSEVALRWFKREMRLTEAPPTPHSGLSWIHLAVMVVLIAFSATMIGMYFHKMRRAAALLESLTGSSGLDHKDADARHRTPSAGTSEGPAMTPPSPNVPPRKWSGKLRVARVFQETPDVKTYRLMSPLGGILPFEFLPGQFLTVGVPVEGKVVRRSYSIASSPSQRDYAELTIKREEGGVVSGFLHEHIREGDLLELSGPMGSFTFTGRECKCILLIGGGVGITPLMSVLRYLVDRSWGGDIYVLYCVHSPKDIIYREELDYLARRHAHLHVVVTVTHPEGTDWGGATGRITKELISRSVPDVASRYAHICGPVPLMEAAKQTLIELGVPRDRIRLEAFGPALGKPEPGISSEQRSSKANVEIDAKLLPLVTFSASERSAPLPPEKTILEVADALGVDIDNSCRVGTCGVCRVKLRSGSVTMEVREGLQPGDEENGIVLACQAKSTGNVTVEA